MYRCILGVQVYVQVAVCTGIDGEQLARLDKMEHYSL